MIVVHFAMCKPSPGRTEACDVAEWPACGSVLLLLFPKSKK